MEFSLRSKIRENHFSRLMLLCFHRMLKDIFALDINSYTLGDYYVFCNTIGVFASAAGLIVSAYGIHLSFFGVLNESLKGQSYNYLVCCAAFFSFELVLLVFGFMKFGWQQAYKRVRSCKSFFCIKWK